MRYTFHAYGHPNIRATHKTTLEFTKDKELTLKGDCIVGVKADFQLAKIEQLIKNNVNKRVTITIKSNKNIKEIISAELNPSFNSDREIVIRKTNFASDRTFAINSNKAAFDLKRDSITFLKEKRNKIIVVIEDKLE